MSCDPLTPSPTVANDFLQSLDALCGDCCRPSDAADVHDLVKTRLSALVIN